MTRFKLHPLAVAIAVAAIPVGYVQAQTEAQADQIVEEEVIVTGFRAALQNSIALKQTETSIVEAISAEDIGKLPDTSIAESLARLPGLAGERREGRTSGIAVRGFNENYVATTMNGRELLGIGDNRGVEYDLYPSEIIRTAVVYKTPDASLINQGLGGTVDLRTIRPLETERIIALSGNYEMNELSSANPDFDDTGHRLAFTVSDSFLDDTVGVALAIATMESPSQEEQFRSWGYADVAIVDDEGNSRIYDPVTNPDGVVTEGPGVTLEGGEKILGGHDTFVRSSMMERDTFSAVVQWQPIADVLMTFDALYIDFLDSRVFRGIEEGGPQFSDVRYTVLEVEDGLVTAGEWQGFRSVIRNDSEEKDAKLSTFGFNVEYQYNDAWSFAADIAYGESSKDIVNIESYSGVSRGTTVGDNGGMGAARSWRMTPNGAFYGDHSTLAAMVPDYSDPADIVLAGPQAWGGAVDYRFADDNSNDAQDGFINAPSFDEELTTLNLQARGEIDFHYLNAVEFGFNYSDRTKDKTNYGAFLTSPLYPGAGPIPEAAIVGAADLSFAGLGEIVAYDVDGISYLIDGEREGYIETAAGLTQPDRLGDTYEISEEVMTFYVMATFEYEMLTGNVGVQYIDTTQGSKGYDALTVDPGFVEATPLEEEYSYGRFLPSVNLNFQITDEQLVRIAASRTQSRPRMDEMKVNQYVNFDFDTGRRTSSDPDFSAWSRFVGNASLEPLVATQYDISYEYYYTEEGYMAASLFYKDLANWHIDNRVVEDFTPYFIPGYHDAGLPTAGGDEFASFEGPSTLKEEAGSGRVRGIELQASVPFTMLNEALDGFGLIASATFLDGEIEHEGTESAIPGLSEESYQLTAYYERNGWEFRVSGRKRDEFLTEFPGLSLTLTETTDLGAELWDAQIGYDFADGPWPELEGLAITLQAQNFTDEETVSADADDPRQINKYQRFGANYLLGFTFTF